MSTATSPAPASTPCSTVIWASYHALFRGFRLEMSTRLNERRSNGSTVACARWDWSCPGFVDTYQPVVKVGHSGIDTTALLFYTGGHGDGHDT